MLSDETCWQDAANEVLSLVMRSATPTKEQRVERKHINGTIDSELWQLTMNASILEVSS